MSPNINALAHDTGRVKQTDFSKGSGGACHGRWGVATTRATTKRKGYPAGLVLGLSVGGRKHATVHTPRDVQSSTTESPGVLAP